MPATATASASTSQTDTPERPAHQRRAPAPSSHDSDGDQEAYEESTSAIPSYTGSKKGGTGVFESPGSKTRTAVRCAARFVAAFVCSSEVRGVVCSALAAWDHVVCCVCSWLSADPAHVAVSFEDLSAGACPCWPEPVEDAATLGVSCPLSDGVASVAAGAVREMSAVEAGGGRTSRHGSRMWSDGSHHRHTHYAVLVRITSM